MDTLEFSKIQARGKDSKMVKINLAFSFFPCYTLITVTKGHRSYLNKASNIQKGLADMEKFLMVVSKKVDGEYQEVGKVDIFYPLLSELGIKVDPKSPEGDTSKFARDEAGFPVYETEELQYAFDAVLAAVKAQARNKLVSGTATLKDGLKIAETVEELLESGSGNKGEALAIVRAFLAAFKAWLPSTKKSEKVQAAVYELASNRKGLALQPTEKKGKFRVYLADFISTLNAENATKFSRPILALEEACSAIEEDI